MAYSLPSPAPSSTSVLSTTHLPHPRGHALRPGSAKEDKVRHFVSDRMMHISRRFIKKSGAAPPGSEEVEGYKSMGELCKDLEGVINIVWLSGTRTCPCAALYYRAVLTPAPQPASKSPTS